MQQIFTGVGLMSGTSTDGLDLAAVRFRADQDQWYWEFLATETHPYDAGWAQRLANGMHTDAAAYAKLHVDYGHWLGMRVRMFCTRHQINPDYVAAHGHTVFHQPEAHFTAQIGDGETLASYLNCPLVTNFRNKDVALGGQGAPLVPVGELALFSQCEVFLNLGGIANLSILNRSHGALLPSSNGHQVTARPPARFRLHSWKGLEVPLVGYDVCACNQVLNHLAQKLGKPMDRDGKLAAHGHVVPELLHTLEQIPFYTLIPPRTLGREWIETEILPLVDRWPPGDALRTYVQHIVQQLSRELDRFEIRDTQMLITGGGAHHSFLVEALHRELKTRDMGMYTSTPELIDFKEALIFAFLGLQTLLQRPNTVEPATGAREAAVCGSIHLPPKGLGDAHRFRIVMQ